MCPRWAALCCVNDQIVLSESLPETQLPTRWLCRPASGDGPRGWVPHDGCLLPALCQPRDHTAGQLEEPSPEPDCADTCAGFLGAKLCKSVWFVAAGGFETRSHYVAKVGLELASFCQ